MYTECFEADVSSNHYTAMFHTTDLPSKLPAHSSNISGEVLLFLFFTCIFIYLIFI